MIFALIPTWLQEFEKEADYRVEKEVNMKRILKTIIGVTLTLDYAGKVTTHTWGKPEPKYTIIKGGVTILTMGFTFNVGI